MNTVKHFIWFSNNSANMTSLLSLSLHISCISSSPISGLFISYVLRFPVSGHIFCAMGSGLWYLHFLFILISFPRPLHFLYWSLSLDFIILRCHGSPSLKSTFLMCPRPFLWLLDFFCVLFSLLLSPMFFICPGLLSLASTFLLYSWFPKHISLTHQLVSFLFSFLVFGINT